MPTGAEREQKNSLETVEVKGRRSQEEERLTVQSGCRFLKAWLGLNTDLSGSETVKRHLSDLGVASERRERAQSRLRGPTWEHEDEAGCQSSDHGDDPTDVWGEERQNQRDDKPHQSLQDAPPFLTADAHLHLLASEAQPQSFYHGPGYFNNQTSGPH